MKTKKNVELNLFEKYVCGRKVKLTCAVLDLSSV